MNVKNDTVLSVAVFFILLFLRWLQKRDGFLDWLENLQITYRVQGCPQTDIPARISQLIRDAEAQL